LVVERLETWRDTDVVPGLVVVPRGAYGYSLPRPVLADDTTVSNRYVNQRPIKLTEDDQQVAALDLYGVCDTVRWIQTVRSYPADS
jgi:hypothetical protein